MHPDEGDDRAPHAIVIGLDSMNGIQTARILARRRIPVIAVAKDPKHYCCKTRVCQKIIFADTAGIELIETLETLGPTLAQKGVLYPCTDMNVLLLSRHRHRLLPWFHVILPPSNVIEMLMDKTRFYHYAREHALPIPATRFLQDRADAEAAAGEMTFPCVLKPPLSAIPRWEENSKLKAYRVFSPAEFLERYDLCHAWADTLIVQEWVEGPDSALVSCNCYLDDRSRPVATFVARKLRQWPPVTGESSLGEACRDDVVLNQALALFTQVGLRGLGYLEMKRDVRTGAYFILEPNIGRPTGRSAIAEAGGVELLYTMYCDAVGWPRPAGRGQRYEGVKWISLRRDLQSAFYHWRRGELTPREWWQSVRGRKVYALLDWRDPGPFIGDLVRCARLYLSPGERGKRDYATAL